MIAVTGASGRLGRLTVRSLLERVDAARVVALTRTPDTLADLPVATRPADFDDPDGLRRAFDGVDRALLISTNAASGTGRRTCQHAAAIRAATRAGVGHLVYTSVTRAGDPAHPAADAAEHRATEAALAASGLPHTVLRNSVYSQMLLVGLDSVLAAGMLVDNAGGGATGYVSREDCAAVAAAVLAGGGPGGGYDGERLEVTGPAALSHAEVAALITKLSGVRVRYEPISDEEAVAGLVLDGRSERAARLIATLGRSVRDGYTNLVTDVVERVGGRPATSVAEVLAAHLRRHRAPAPVVRRTRKGCWTRTVRAVGAAR